MKNLLFLSLALSMVSFSSTEAFTLQSQKEPSLLKDSMLTHLVLDKNTTSIFSITTNKQNYVKGDMALITVGINVFSKETGKLYAITNIKTFDTGSMCIEPTATSVIHPDKISFIVPITNDCNGYIVSVTITNDKDSILNRSTLFVPPNQDEAVIRHLNYLLILGTSIILLSALVKRRSKLSML